MELLYIPTPSSRLSVLEIGAYLKRSICPSIPIFCFNFFSLQTTVSKDITQFGYTTTIGLAQFHEQVLNRPLDMTVNRKGGRPRKTRTMVLFLSSDSSHH